MHDLHALYKSNLTTHGCLNGEVMISTGEPLTYTCNAPGCTFTSNKSSGITSQYRIHKTAAKKAYMDVQASQNAPPSTNSVSHKEDDIENSYHNSDYPIEDNTPNQNEVNSQSPSQSSIPNTNNFIEALQRIGLHHRRW